MLLRQLLVSVISSFLLASDAQTALARTSTTGQYDGTYAYIADDPATLDVDEHRYYAETERGAVGNVAGFAAICTTESVRRWRPSC